MLTQTGHREFDVNGIKGDMTNVVALLNGMQPVGLHRLILWKFTKQL